MKSRRWTAFKLIAMLLVVISVAGAFLVRKTDENMSWLLLGLTAVLSIVFLALFSAFQKNLHKFVTEMKSQLNLTERDSLYRFPAPAAIVDSEGVIIWYNIAFTEQVYGSDAFGVHISSIINADFEKIIANKNIAVEFESNHFKVTAVTAEKTDGDSGAVSDLTILHFEDISDYITLEAEMFNAKPSVLIISIDNYDDILINEKDSEKAHIMIQIEKLLETYFEEHRGVMRKISSDKYFAVIEDRYLKEIIDDKFKILDSVRAIPVSEKTSVTLSIGVGLGALYLVESEKFAKQALEMAQGRGGDQAAIKTDGGFEFFGGVSKGIEKNTKVKTRIVAAALTELINSSPEVLIMGHVHGDMDCIGAGAGLCGAIRILNPDKYVRMVVNTGKTLAKPIIERINENLRDEEEHFISPDEAAARITRDTLLIIVDTHNRDIVEFPELYEKAGKIAVIDHHRQTVNYIDNAVIFHHEPYASSACEMVAEIIQYFQGINKLSSYYADAMLAGIMLDTKNFIMRTGVRTFEASAFLRKLGADMVAVKGLFANSVECIQKRSKLVSTAEIYQRCAIALDEEHNNESRLASAQAADELLEIENVDASFVIFYTSAGVSISARSMGAMNVQIIMEKLGGGGHNTMAAAQFGGITVFEAKAKLVSAIDEHIANIS